ncbi:hypothetical protein BCBD1442_28280 [Brucella ceti]|nr:hypothetical protein BCBD1442_28280 [Brucella ceti]
MALDGCARIDIERRADGLGYFGQADIFSVENAVAIFKVVHGKCPLRGMELQYLVENEGLVFLRFLLGMTLIVGYDG